MQASPAPAEALCPLAACAALAAKLLGRAVTACTAAGGPAAGHTVRLELVQSPDQPAVLVLRGAAASLATWPPNFGILHCLCGHSAPPYPHHYSDT
jgi:hypothetical protein